MALTLTTGKSRPGDKIYLAVLSFSALVLFVLIVGIATTLAWQSRLSLQATGFKFVTLSVWDDAAGIYGIWPFLFGTLYSSLIALLLAVPISLGAAIFLAELCPKWLRTPITFLIELLAAIPSIVYGLWRRARTPLHAVCAAQLSALRERATK